MLDAFLDVMLLWFNTRGTQARKVAIKHNGNVSICTQNYGIYLLALITFLLLFVFRHTSVKKMCYYLKMCHYVNLLQEPCWQAEWQFGMGVALPTAKITTDCGRGGRGHIFKSLPAIKILYLQWCLRKTHSIIGYHSHPVHQLFSWLLSGTRYRSVAAGITRLKSDFYCQAIGLLTCNTWHLTAAYNCQISHVQHAA